MMTGDRPRSVWYSLLAGSVVLGAIVATAAPAKAQLTPDLTTLPTPSTVGPDQVINGIPSNQIGAGTQVGINLFHSFIDFNVAAGRGVYFTNPVGVDNILTRVIGGNPSNIFGRLGVLGPANLFLINPSGIVFGPGASLDVQGSFTATTNNAIPLGTTGLFSATNPASSTLINVQPGALFLNALTTQNITNQAVLQAGQNLTLVASSIDNQGLLQAGQTLNAQANSISNSGIFQAGQGLNLSGTTTVSTGSLLVPTGQLSITAGNAQLQGTITAQTGIVSTNSDLIVLNSQITTTGDLTLRSQTQVQLADSITIPLNLSVGGNLLIQGIQGVGIDALKNPGSLFQSGGNFAIASNGNIAAVGLFSSGGNTSFQAGGNLTVSQSQFTGTGDLALESQGILTLEDGVNTPVTTTLGGNLLVRGGQGITLQFSNPASALQTPANLNIASDRTINATGVLSSGGSTTVSAGDNLFLTSSQVTSTGGNIALSAAGNLGLNQDQLTAPLGNVLLSAQRQVSIQDGATPFLASAGGNLFVQGNQGITIQAVNPTSLLASTGDLSLVSPAGAIASNIPIQAGGAFSIQASGDLTFGNYTGPSLNLFSGGNLTLGTVDTSSNNGNGGAVTLGATGNVAANAILTFSTAAVGNGGAVSITAGGSILTTLIDATSVSGSGGAVTQQAGNGIAAGTINTFAQNGPGGAVSLVANQNIATGTIDTVSVTGNGGNIRILSRNGTIDTTAGELRAFAGDDSGLNGVNGGEITLQANGNLAVGTIRTDGGALGGGGNLQLLSDRGTVSVAPGQNIFSWTLGAGNGGNIRIAGQSISLGTGAEIDSSNFGTGNAGSITLQAVNELTSPGSLGNPTVLFATAEGPTGSAGNVTIAAGRVALTATEIFTTVSALGTGRAGNIAVTASGAGITLTNSFLGTNNSGTGLAGDVSLSAPAVALQDSTIDVAAFGTGVNGNIGVTATQAGNVLLSGGTFFTDTFQSNIGTDGGDITIRGGNVTLNNFQLDAIGRGSVNGNSILIEASNRVALANNSLVSTEVESTATGRGGNITVRAGEISLTGSSGIVATTASLSPSGSGGNVVLSAANGMTLTPGSQIRTTAGPGSVADGGGISLATQALALDGARIDASTAGSGRGGEVAIDVGTLNVLGGGQLVSSTSGSGAAGRMNIRAGQAIAIAGNGSGLFAESSGTGSAGDLAIATPRLLVQDGGEISVTTRGTGAGGRLAVDVNQLQVSRGGEISASTTGAGNGGLLTVNAGQSIVLDGGSRLAARSTGSGSAGNLAITTDRFLVQSGAQATVSSSGTGDAGNLDVTARTITLTTNGRLAADTVSGNGGSIQVSAREDLIVQDGAEISTSSTDTGNAGKITAQADSLFLTSGGRIISRSTDRGNAGSIGISLGDRLRISGGEISASSELGGGGQIGISARDILLNNSSLISSSVSDGSGGGGNIILRASEMFMAFNDSDILANAKVGDGGNITIDSPVFIADLFANVGRNPGKDFSRFRGNGRVDISATSVFGGTGTVNIPDTSFIQYSLSTMEGEFVPAEQIVAGTCLARRNSQQSSFVVTGTGGLARTPYAQVAGRYDVVQVQPLGNEAPGVNNRNLSREPAPESPLLSWKSGDPVQEAQGFIRTPDGRVVIGTAPQLASVILAQDLVCNFRSQNP